MPVLLAQETAPPQPQPAAPTGPAPGGGMGMFYLLIPLILIWWFLVIRPQSKAEKARRAKLAAVQKGDKVRTRGGILGVVVRIKDDELTVRIDPDAKVDVQVARSYVDEILDGAGAPATKS